MSEYRINLAKAKDAEHAEYMFRLMICLNDLLSIRQLLALTEHGRDSVQQEALASYLIRMFNAHLVEACVAFVERVMPVGSPPRPQHSVYDFIEQHDACLAKFKGLMRLIKTENFNRLRTLRHTFAFHYNYEDQSVQTVEALDKLLEKSVRCPSSGENLIVYTDDPTTTRFVLADELINVGWRMLIGIDECVQYKSDSSMAKYQEFLGKVGLLFLDFSQVTVLKWIDHCKLQA